VIVFDATMMLLLMRPDVRTPIGKNGKPVEYAKERIAAFIDRLEKEKKRIILPTPALSELLVRAGSDTNSLVSTIQKSPVFRIEPFNTLAAIEVAIMTRQAIDNGDKRGGIDSTWAKVKYDRQIIAIARVHGATTIYSDDEDICVHAKTANIEVLRLEDLPIPQKMMQGELSLTTSEAVPKNQE